MKRHLISLALLMLNIPPMIAYDRHGRDYSVRDGGGSSSSLLILIVVGVIANVLFNAGSKKN